MANVSGRATWQLGLALIVSHLTPHTSHPTPHHNNYLDISCDQQPALWLVELVAVWRIVAEIWQTLGWFVGHLCPITPHTGLSITPDTAPPPRLTTTLTLIITRHYILPTFKHRYLGSVCHPVSSPIKYWLYNTVYVNMPCIKAPVTKPPEHHSFILTNLLGKLYNWETDCESYKCSDVIIQYEEPASYICVWLQNITLFALRLHKICHKKAASYWGFGW